MRAARGGRRRRDGDAAFVYERPGQPAIDGGCRRQYRRVGDAGDRQHDACGGHPGSERTGCRRRGHDRQAAGRRRFDGDDGESNRAVRPRVLYVGLRSEASDLQRAGGGPLGQGLAECRPSRREVYGRDRRDLGLDGRRRAQTANQRDEQPPQRRESRPATGADRRGDCIAPCGRHGRHRPRRCKRTTATRARRSRPCAETRHAVNVQKRNELGQTHRLRPTGYIDELWRRTWSAEAGLIATKGAARADLSR